MSVAAPPLFPTIQITDPKKPPLPALLALEWTSDIVANSIESICAHLDTSSFYPKFIGASFANVSLSVAKDLYFTRAFSKAAATSSTPVATRPVPFRSYGLYTLRDSMTIFASFNLPTLLAQRLTETFEVKKARAEFLAQLITPCAVQLVSTPLHLVGMDLYNRPGVSSGERVGFVRKEYWGTSFARMGRIFPAYGIGGVVNKEMRKKGKEYLAEKYASKALTIVKRIEAPASSGYVLAFLTLAAENIPGLASAIAASAGVYNVRNNTAFAKDPATFMPLPFEGWKRNTVEEGKGLTLKEIYEIGEHESVREGSFGFRAFHQAYLSKKTNPVEVCKALLDRIQSTHNNSALTPSSSSSSGPVKNPLNHLCQANAELILEQAQASMERYNRGAPLSVLDGVPVAVKDEVDVAGYETRVGTKFLNLVADDDAFSVDKLRKAGAILIGKATMEEIGWSVFSANTFGGVPRNPHDTERSCGGSSGGSAGAVAAGFCPISIGCDGGGSVRIPASFCGLFGLKPTHCRISPRGTFPLCQSVGVQGPIASTADDLTAAYLAIAGPDEKNPHSLLQPPVHVPRSYLQPSMKGIRIGIFPDYNAQTNNSGITKAMDFIQQKLVEHGAELVPVPIPFLDDIRMAHAIVISSEMRNSMTAQPKSHQLTWANRLMMVVSSLYDSRDYIRSNQIRTHLIRTLIRCFSKDELNLQYLLTPSTAITAPRIPTDAVLARGGYSDVPLSSDAMRYVFISNFGGIPAVTVPVGTDDDGMPVGVQFMSEWWAESRLLEAAKWVEKVILKEGEGKFRISTPKNSIGPLF
ncbi:hypothetical protein HDU97_007009 [Phlyctochytrium planicorne]|nr:hypothetical protein HDU97_007009 [Phlyctochytrium planicorne]